MELHQIFLDMSVLVEAQGEMLDNIEAQVGKSVEYVRENVALVPRASLPEEQPQVHVLLAHMPTHHRERHPPPPGHAALTGGSA